MRVNKKLFKKHVEGGYGDNPEYVNLTKVAKGFWYIVWPFLAVTFTLLLIWTILYYVDKSEAREYKKWSEVCSQLAKDRPHYISDASDNANATSCRIIGDGEIKEVKL